MSSKVFCPLKTKYYNLFKEGRKKWEFRRLKSSVARSALKHGVGAPIELTHGYSDDSLWGRIVEIKKFPSVDAIPAHVLKEGACNPSGLLKLLGDGEIVAIKVALRGEFDK